MRSKLAMTLAALGAAVIVGSGPVSAAPVTGSAIDASRAAVGQSQVEEVGRRYHRRYYRRHYGPRVYGFYGRPYYRRHYGPRFYRPYYYGGYPYYYRRRPGIYFGFGF